MNNGQSRRPIRLIHVTTVPLSFRPFFSDQAEFMREHGIETGMISSPGPEASSFAASEGVEVLTVPMLRRIAPLRDLIALCRIWRALRRIRPHIVHSHTPKGGLLGMVGAWLAGVPVRVYSLRGLPLTTASGPRRLVLKLSDMLAAKLAHRVISVGEGLRKEAVEEGICDPGKIYVLSSGSGQGVDATRRFNPASLGDSVRASTRARLGVPADALLLGFVGRIVRDKGIVELAEAWSRLRQEFPSLHMLLVGPFEDGDAVSPELRAGLEADPRVHLAGLDWNTPPLYAAMDVVVLPSHREGFPNVPLEAAAMRLPVVATRLPGCHDAVLDGVTGLLVPARDPVALAAALRRYLRDPELRRTHGDAARARVILDFRREVVWEAVLMHYRELTSRQGISGASPAPSKPVGLVAAGMRQR
jgi:glycosyltransferase involved in cell wall biosynthesis